MHESVKKITGKGVVVVEKNEWKRKHGATMKLSQVTQKE